MGVIATNALEPRQHLLSEHRQLLVNLELNNDCPNTAHCPMCYLGVVAPAGRRPIPLTTVLEAAREIIHHGSDVRHFALPGKEVWQSPDLLLRIVEEYHATPSDDRPATIGIITASSAGLRRHVDRLRYAPLTWCLISLDADNTGLRNERNNSPLLQAALELKATGGVGQLGINTVITTTNLEGVIRIGRQLSLLEEGLQWTLGPMLEPRAGRMEPTLTAHQFRPIIRRISDEFADSRLEILFDLDLPLFADLVADPRVLVSGGSRWRYEFQLPSAPNILLEAGNPAPGYFVRMNWAGQVLSKEDYRQIAPIPTFNDYAPGRFIEIFEGFRALRAVPAPV